MIMILSIVALDTFVISMSLFLTQPYIEEPETKDRVSTWIAMFGVISMLTLLFSIALYLENHRPGK